MCNVPQPLPVEDLRIAPLFHPILSTRTGGIIGAEALARFPDYPGVSPEVFFTRARAQGRALDLDRRCREAAVASFLTLPADSNALLFLNLDADVFRPDVVGSGRLASLFQEAGIPPQRVVIEVLENRAASIESLHSFVQEYRRLGFLIGIDDIGSGYSNLNRITVIKPDIIKIDRSLVSGIDSSHHKQAVVSSLVGLGRRIGALVVGEGVEEQAEAFTLLELDVDLFQGFHYCLPMPAEEIYSTPVLDSVAARMEELRAHGRRAAGRYQWYLALLQETTRSIGRRLGKDSGLSIEQILEEEVGQNPAVISAYTLDTSGEQTSETIGRAGREVRSGLFSPAEKGADQSLKQYYLNLSFGASIHISDPYISLADGRVCRTCSVHFSRGEYRGILCVDFESRGE